MWLDVVIAVAVGAAFVAVVGYEIYKRITGKGGGCDCGGNCGGACSHCTHRVPPKNAREK